MYLDISWNHMRKLGAVKIAEGVAKNSYVKSNACLRSSLEKACVILRASSLVKQDADLFV